MKLTRGGIFVPDDDWYFPMALDDDGMFERENLALALSFVPPDRRRVAVDGGAHVGTWTRELARSFETVLAWEPHPDNFACLFENTRSRYNVYTFQKALGERVKTAHLGDGSNTGCHYLIEDSAGTVQVEPLPPLHALDFMKLDLEGYEYFAIAGAREQVEKYRPVILVEEKPLAHAIREGWPQARTLLRDMGYAEAARCRRDVIFIHKGDA